ncbi:MAG: hypothetical protein PVJ47_08840 [Thiohalocapsa sp.]|jgi:hypothetical protein
MNPFVEQHQDEIGCVISCFDRVVITGTLPDICHARAMVGYLGGRGIRLFDYAHWAEPLRDEIRANAERWAAEAGLEIEFIPQPGRPAVGTTHSESRVIALPVPADVVDAATAGGGGA